MSCFRVLGPVEVWTDEHRLALAGPQQVALLTFLLLNANRAVSADAVIDAVWGSEREGAARRLQTAVFRLRRALAPLDRKDASRLRTVSGGYLLSVGPDELDAELFTAAVRDGRRAFEDGDPARARELLAQGLAMWRGPPLADVAFAEFAQAEIRRLEELWLVGTEVRIDADLQLGRHADVIAELETLLAEQPTRERLAGQLMTALYRYGRQADALQVYQRTRSRLAEDLGLEPGPALKALESQILSQDQSLAEPFTSEHHRRTEGPGDRVDHDKIRLPAPASAFLGRSSELGDLTLLLKRREPRVLTLTGAGGIGKTRLALRLAEVSAAAYRDGAVFVGFAEIADPDLIVPTICEELGVATRGEGAQIQQLKNWLSERQLLLVLDNLEHLASGTAVLGELLEASPGLVLLVTSRQPLHLVGEHQYHVRGLTYADAVELFTRRAAAVAPLGSGDSKVAGKICDRLDALPLAIELAAARTVALSPVEILARLDNSLSLLTGGPRDAPERQRTLRATIDWSCQLLSVEERRLFARLAVFAGGWTLPAAEEICGADLDALQALVAASLVQRQDDRFSMLAVLREYARERLEHYGELDELRRRHHRWFARLLDEELDAHRARLAGGPPWETGHPWPSPSSLPNQERENIRAALLWALKERRGRGWMRG